MAFLSSYNSDECPLFCNKENRKKRRKLNLLMFNNIYYKLKTALASNPTIYIFAIKFFLSRDNFNFPKKNTNLFIFAYPRSGNDYAKQLAKNYNSKLSISSHYHRPSMLLHAIKLKIPTIAAIC